MPVKILINSFNRENLLGSISKLRGLFYKTGKDTAPSIGLSLSGGGTRGFMHLGVLKALDEKKLSPSMIVGTSSGSMAGAFYAAGYKPDEVLSIMKKVKLRSLMVPSMTNKGIFDIERATSFLKDYLPETFEELKMPLVINAVDYVCGQSVYFTKGNLLKPIQASSCVPGLFKPVSYQGMTLIDGGVLNNMPADPLIGRCKYIIGSHSNCNGHVENASNIRGILERTFNLAINGNVERERSKFDLVIEPREMVGKKVYDFSKAEDVFNIGYDFTMELFRSAEYQQQQTDAYNGQQTIGSNISKTG